MKRKIWIKRKDRIRQRYRVGRKAKRNFGSQIVRQKIREDLPLLSKEKQEILDKSLPGFDEILPSEHRRKELIRVFEKNPELYKEYRETKPKILFHKGTTSKTYPDRNIITISDPESGGWLIYDKKEGVHKRLSLEPQLRHELRHISDFSKINDYERWKEIPRSLKESSAESAEHISLRRRKIPQKAVDINVEHFFRRQK